MDADPLNSLTAETAYLFRHAVVRDAAYELQLPTEREGLHALALDVLESVEGLNLDAVGLELAQHARLAGDDERHRRAEREYLDRGADYARFNYDYPNALAGFERLYNLLADDDAARAGVADKLADMMERLGRFDDAVEYFKEVRANHPDAEHVGRALVHLAWFGSDDEDETERYATEGEKLAEQTDSNRLRIAFLQLRAKQLHERGMHDHSMARLKEAIEFARGTGDHTQELIARMNASEYESRAGNFVEAERHNEIAERISADPRLKHIRIGVELNRASLFLRVRQFDDALKAAREAIALSEATGARGTLAWGLIRRASAECGQGRYVDSFQTLESAREILAETRDLGQAIAMLEARAVLLRLWGKQPQLLPELEEALAELATETSAAALKGLRAEIALCRAELRHQQEGLDVIGKLARESKPGDAIQVHYAALLASTGRHREALGVLDAWRAAAPVPPVSAEPLEFLASYWRAQADGGDDTIREAIRIAQTLRLDRHPSPLLAEMLQRLRNQADSLDLN